MCVCHGYRTRICYRFLVENDALLFDARRFIYKKKWLFLFTFCRGFNWPRDCLFVDDSGSSAYIFDPPHGCISLQLVLDFFLTKMWSRRDLNCVLSDTIICSFCIWKLSIDCCYCSPIFPLLLMQMFTIYRFPIWARIAFILLNNCILKPKIKQDNHHLWCNCVWN